MEDEKSVKPKQPPSIPANYVTIVELQERWIKERQRIDKEKQDQERRVKQEEKNRPEKQKERDSNYVTIVDLRERRRKEKHENERMMQEEEKKKRAEKQSRVRSERDSNFVTIVDLQERWIKERQRKEKEKQDQERLQKEIDSKKVEPAPGHRNRRFPPRNNRNAVPRRENLEGSGKPKPRAEKVTVEDGSRVGRKSDDGDLGEEGAPEIEEKFENLSLKGVNRETSARANGPRIEGSRNEERCHGTNPRRNGGNWNVGINGDADKVLVCDQSGSNPSINPGNRMQGNVKVDGKLEKVRVRNAGGRSNPNITKSSEIKGGNWNVDGNGNADKVLVCDQSGSNPIINPANKMRRNVKIDGKLEKVPVGNASGRSNTNITKSSEMDRKLMKAVTSGTREGSTSSSMMDGAVGIDGNFEIVPTVGSNTSNGGNRVNKNFHTEGKCEKVRIIARGRGYSRVEVNGFKRGVCIDRPEKVWVKKGEVFAGNAGRGQNSGRYSMGSK